MVKRTPSEWLHFSPGTGAFLEVEDPRDQEWDDEPEPEPRSPRGVGGDTSRRRQGGAKRYPGRLIGEGRIREHVETPTHRRIAELCQPVKSPTI